MASCKVGLLNFVVLLCLAHEAWAGCGLKAVRDDETKYTFKLWGKELTRSCDFGEFYQEQCRCEVSPVSAVYKGKRVKIADMPWSLSLHVQCPIKVNDKYEWEKKELICGAVLVGKTWALTAQHCYIDNCLNGDTGAPYPRFYVRGGAKNAKRGGVLSKVIDAYLPLASYQVLDVVTLRLDDNLMNAESRSIRPIALAIPPRKHYNNHSCMMAGFGDKRKDPNEHVAEGEYRLTGAKMVIVKKADCYGKGTQSQLCVENEGERVPCSGDSGSPLWCVDAFGGTKLVGIFATSYGDCERTKPRFETFFFTSTQLYFQRLRDIRKTVHDDMEEVGGEDGTNITLDCQTDAGLVEWTQCDPGNKASKARHIARFEIGVKPTSLFFGAWNNGDVSIERVIHKTNSSLTYNILIMKLSKKRDNGIKVCCIGGGAGGFKQSFKVIVYERKWELHMETDSADGAETSDDISVRVYMDRGRSRWVKVTDAVVKGKTSFRFYFKTVDKGNLVKFILKLTGDDSWSGKGTLSGDGEKKTCGKFQWFTTKKPLRKCDDS